MRWKSVYKYSNHSSIINRNIRLCDAPTDIILSLNITSNICCFFSIIHNPKNGVFFIFFFNFAFYIYDSFNANHHANSGRRRRTDNKDLKIDQWQVLIKRACLYRFDRKL